MKLFAFLGLASRAFASYADCDLSTLVTVSCDTTGFSYSFSSSSTNADCQAFLGMSWNVYVDDSDPVDKTNCKNLNNANIASHSKNVFSMNTDCYGRILDS